MDSLYDDADLYDLVAPPDDAMERFYVEAAGGPGRRVLELACGSGRFTAPLAASGALVIGGDLSETMLSRARAAVAACRPISSSSTCAISCSAGTLTPSSSPPTR